mmetsp:Transcript_34898/g.35449  ORF Transcript_34898/g.35449 Transcript_34898/m.35449 type:complete len:146 (+) Transcript_34898:502-939(+)
MVLLLLLVSTTSLPSIAVSSTSTFPSGRPDPTAAAAAAAVTTVPCPMVAKVVLLTLALFAKTVPLVFGKLLVVTASKIESLLHENLTSSWSIEGIQSSVAHAAQPHPTARASTAVARNTTTGDVVTVATTPRRRQRSSVTERILA